MRPTLLATAVAALAASLGAPATAQDTAHATFIDASGNELGEARLTAAPDGVLIHVDLEGLPSGEHGFHIHETGRCDAPDFTSAGGHFATGQKHGFLVEGGPHPGDLPNQFVGEDGRLRADIYDARLSFDGGEAPLFDEDGAAFIVHRDPDDYESQPAGAAGPRIACAVIERG